MPFRKPSRNRLRSLCAEVHPDDGSDPRVFFRKDGSSGKPDHKARQLCRQVADVLGSLLDDLQVVGVEPMPDSTRLLVTVTPKLPDDPNDPAAILGRLNLSASWLRGEVAAAITRRRVPLLSYRVVQIRPGSAGVGG